jgi:hypothetical protein
MQNDFPPAPSGADRLLYGYLGLKPQAASFNPFGITFDRPFAVSPARRFAPPNSLFAMRDALRRQNRSSHLA